MQQKIDLQILLFGRLTDILWQWKTNLAEFFKILKSQNLLFRPNTITSQYLISMTTPKNNSLYYFNWGVGIQYQPPTQYAVWYRVNTVLKTNLLNMSFYLLGYFLITWIACLCTNFVKQFVINRLLCKVQFTKLFGPFQIKCYSEKFREIGFYRNMLIYHQLVEFQVWN